MTTTKSFDLRIMTTKDGVAVLKEELMAYLKAGATSGRTLGDFVLVFSTNHTGRRYGALNQNGLPVRRVIDRALQKLRAEGSIAYHKKQWFLSTDLVVK